MPRLKKVQSDDEHEEDTAVVLIGTGDRSHSFEIYRQVRETRRTRYRRNDTAGFDELTDCTIRIEAVEKTGKPQNSASNDSMQVHLDPPKRKRRVHGIKRADLPKPRKRKAASEWQ